MLARGADSTVVGADSFNALHVCADKNDITTLNVLLDAGTSIKKKTRDGLTAYDIAKQKHYDVICDRLMRSTDQMVRTVDDYDADISSIDSTRPVGDGLVTGVRSSANSLRTLTRSMYVQSPPLTSLPAEEEERDGRFDNLLTPRRFSNLGISNSLPSLRPIVFGTTVTNNQQDYHTAMDISIHNQGHSHSSSNSSSSSKNYNTQQPSYSIIGQNSGGLGSGMGSEGIFDETTLALRKLLDKEIKERKNIESKVRQDNSNMM